MYAKEILHRKPPLGVWGSTSFTTRGACCVATCHVPVAHGTDVVEHGRHQGGGAGGGNGPRRDLNIFVAALAVDNLVLC